MLRKILLCTFLASFSPLLLHANDVSGQKNSKLKIITDTFNDKVRAIKETDEGLELHFELYSAIYKINKLNPNFEQLKKVLEKSKSKNKEIKVVVEIPSMEISAAIN